MRYQAALHPVIIPYTSIQRFSRDFSSVCEQLDVVDYFSFSQYIWCEIGALHTKSLKPMYINNEERKAKIGKISVSVSRDNSIKLRFTYPKGKRNDINISTNTDEGWVNALRIAQAINADIELGQFDDTLAKYSPRRSQALEIASKQLNLLDLWETYKQLSKDRVTKTTIKRSWIPWEKHYLGKTPPELLVIDKSSEFIAHLLTRYSAGSLDSIFSNCLMPSVNLAVKTGRIERNPYAAIPLAKKSKKQIEAYEPDEVKAIIRAFYENIYVSKYARKYPHSFYAQKIEFMALTGCRPSECNALVWSDIKQQNNNTFIKFSKAYSVGILVPHTKTHEIRLFPVNEQLGRLIKALDHKENRHNLIFPSVKGGYINQKTFSRRYWNAVINGLIADGILEKHYINYSLRHSFITRMVRSGEDIATIARISGNSTETIVNYYLSAKKNGYDLPEL